MRVKLDREKLPEGDVEENKSKKDWHKPLTGEEYLQRWKDENGHS
jgi:hypothetical protein